MPPLFFQGQVTQSPRLGYECCCVTGLCLAACSGSDALGGPGEGMARMGIPVWGGMLGIGHSQVPAQDSGGSRDRGAWAGFDGPCGRRGARGQARAWWDIPDDLLWAETPIPAPFWGCQAQAGSRGTGGNLSHCPTGLLPEPPYTASNCPHLSWLWTCFQQPSKYSSCNPNPFKPPHPKTSSPCRRVLQKAKNFPAAPLWEHKSYKSYNHKSRTSWHSIPVPCQNIIWDISLGTGRA